MSVAPSPGPNSHYAWEALTPLYTESAPPMSVAAAPPAAPANRRLVAWIALAVVGALLAWQVASILTSDALPIPIDYAAFWSAGWLTIQGENPYDPVRLHEVQR